MPFLHDFSLDSIGSASRGTLPHGRAAGWPHPPAQPEQVPLPYNTPQSLHFLHEVRLLPKEQLGTQPLVAPPAAAPLATSGSPMPGPHLPARSPARPTCGALGHDGTPAQPSGAQNHVAAPLSDLEDAPEERLLLSRWGYGRQRGHSAPPLLGPVPAAREEGARGARHGGTAAPQRSRRVPAAARAAPAPPRGRGRGRRGRERGREKGSARGARGALGRAACAREEARWGRSHQRSWGGPSLAGAAEPASA